ncbi:unnamed protein product [Rotaria sp. Silwood2]|nr:unnamed protein product [Rotaria sp. Silwood2]CAF3009073.1 unnamed protein product [Rotaria sp. Silwood2]CAF3288642.1 unnamed protein product [Rotaria sp. Silwood2]CAF3332526.1 unnamed protein product [Rotaria sp. Silwood2]CAF4344960.1 unnamed protein product [Rotaria sp. Silwood2]
MLLSTDQLFSRNMEFADALRYNLEKVHGEVVAKTLNILSDNLMINAQSLSVCRRECAAFHEDEGKVLTVPTSV